MAQPSWSTTSGTTHMHKCPVVRSHALKALLKPSIVLVQSTQHEDAATNAAKLAAVNEQKMQQAKTDSAQND